MEHETYSAMLKSIRKQLRGLDGPARLFMLTVYSKIYVKNNTKKERNKIRKKLRKRSDRRWYKKIKWQPCACCDKKLNLEIHHIIPIKKGGNNDMRNLISVCSDCHRKIHGEA